MIRTGTMEDCRAVYELICDMEARELPYGEFQEVYRAQRADPRYLLLAAEEDGRVTGCLNLRVEAQLHHAGNIAEILELAVAPGCRNRRLGTALVEAACEAARERGCGQIEVACNQLRRDTHRFYTRCGMRNYHYKFSLRLDGPDTGENALGR